MKLRLCIILLSFLLIAACTKEEFKVNYTNGVAKVTQSDNLITYQANGKKSSNGSFFNFSFYTYNGFGDLRNVLSFTAIPKLPGKYFLTNQVPIQDNLVLSTFSTSLADGDVVEDFYLVRMENGISVGTITILEYHERSGWVKGEFDAEFELTKEIPNNPNNQKIMHLKGEFQLRILER